MSNTLGINEIAAYLPHRYPFLLLDKILDYSDDSVVAIKNVTINEPFFNGHFPGNPVMPGVLQIEAMAQAASFMTYNEFKSTNGKIDVLFLAIESARFKKIVRPGDQLKISISLVKRRKEFWWCEGNITVDGSIVCEAKLTAMLKVGEN